MSTSSIGGARAEELALLFTAARTHSVWSGRSVDEALLRQAYELARMGPTGGNTQPLRIVFVRSAAAKERLRPALFPLNVEKAMTAPVTAILAFDTAYYEKMPKLFPSRPELRDQLAAWEPEKIERLGLQSATLQAGYFILAARALGLDCGPLGGFDAEKTNAVFFPDGKWKSTLLVNLGYGIANEVFPRNPRLDFEEACRID